MQTLRIALFFVVALCLTMSGGCRRAPAPPAFDVPAIIALPIDQATQKLGAPTSEVEGQKTWAKNGATLTVNFKPVSGRITELTLLSRAPEQAVRDNEQAELLVPGQLKSGDSRYTFDYIEATERPFYYDSVRIVPAPRTYKVQLRVTGPPDILQVSYAMSGANPPSQEFTTIAPWNIEATLSDNAQIQLSAGMAQNRAIARSPILAEILVDGKVVASDKVSVIANCNYEL